MNKFRATLVALVVIAIVLCSLLATSALSTSSAPAVLQFAKDHPRAIQGGTVLLLLVTIASLLLIKKRPRA